MSFNAVWNTATSRFLRGFELWELCFSITLGIPTVLSSVLNLENLDLLDPFITFLLNDRLLFLFALNLENDLFLDDSERFHLHCV